jgi:hypothetical protein
MCATVRWVVTLLLLVAVVHGVEQQQTVAVVVSQAHTHVSTAQEVLSQHTGHVSTAQGDM